MGSSRGILFVLITLAIIHIVRAQDQQGYISLDCGLPTYELSPYREASTGLQFSSDAAYIQSGKTGSIQAEYKGSLMKPYTRVRYFPEGIRNCYNLSVEKKRTYLIRATFTYGNYDGKNTGPVFDLYLGPNLWATIDLERVNGTRKDLIHNTTSNSLQICLVRTGETIPLISTVELRPVGNDSYITHYESLNCYNRLYLSKSGGQIRYEEDVYDRIWIPYFPTGWTQISTDLDIVNSNHYVPPKDALKNAATPTNASAPLMIEWPNANPDDQYYLYAHFAEIQNLRANETREFNIMFNGELFYGPVVPLKRVINTIFSKNPGTCEGGICNIQLVRTNRSTLPPLLNAFEICKVIQFPQSETYESEKLAIKSIESIYGLSKTNWQGDPCVPQQLRWDGLNCSNTNISTPPRITSLNLSSSGLNGTIAAAIQNLKQLENLDLSNNNLTGGVPEFLGNMKSLLVINLSGNNLNGSIPQALRKKGLELLVEGNPLLCLSEPCRKPPNKKVLVPIVASVACAATIIVVLVLFIVLRKQKPTTIEGIHLPPMTPTVNAAFANSPEPSFDQKKRRFTYSEVLKMTNNFQRVLGEGGFGKVYHGTLNGLEEVAVKVLSQFSAQGYKQFKAEVDLLLRVHHTYLVGLVGYCYEEDHLALIYEFLPNGNLKEHLGGGRAVINWVTRLQIALEAALGLEYLHIGCAPPMVHRDVKTSNILLDEHYKAKLADFGLSRPFPVGGESLVSTVIAGTPGYLDPEYYNSGRLGEKSDIYSFGIVLLEMITNQHVIFQKSHITEWVGFKLDRGDINGIMDPNLNGVYDSNSAWRALELAMSCANPCSPNRPTMSHVINELKECLVCENSRISNNRCLEYEKTNMACDTEVVPMER